MSHTADISSLLHNVGGPPIKLFEWRGYRAELAAAGVQVTGQHDLGFGESQWVSVEGYGAWENFKLRNQRNFQKSSQADIESLRQRLSKEGFLRPYILTNRINPPACNQVIKSAWLAWLIIAQKTDFLWSLKRPIVFSKVLSFGAVDHKLSKDAPFFHCSIFLRESERLQLELLVKEWGIV